MSPADFFFPACRALLFSLGSLKVLRYSEDVAVIRRGIYSLSYLLIYCLLSQVLIGIIGTDGVTSSLYIQVTLSGTNQ